MKSIDTGFFDSNTIETINIPEGAMIGSVIGFDQDLISYYQPEVRWQAPTVRGDPGTAYFLSNISSGRGNFTIEFSNDLIHWTRLNSLSNDGGGVPFSVAIDNSVPAGFIRSVDGD